MLPEINMIESLTTRPLKQEDQAIISQMIKELYQSLGASNDYITDKKIQATFEQLQVQPTTLQLEVLELEGVIVGYALLFKFWYNEFGGMVLNIDELFVRSEFRGKGIASHYLRSLEKRKDDFVALSLEVSSENKGAFDLYKRMGFKEKETVTLYKIASKLITS
jgi:ribosomal protein S18 acetylase RimI-like enzyme